MLMDRAFHHSHIGNFGEMALIGASLTDCSGRQSPSYRLLTLLHLRLHMLEGLHVLLGRSMVHRHTPQHMQHVE